MPWTITKEFCFEAAHSLPYLMEGHKCRRLHGHSYRVELVLTSNWCGKTGFAGDIDYADLDEFGRHLNESFDHRNLNEVMGREDTTAEALAEHFYRWAKQRWANLTAVRLYETAKTCVEYAQ